VPDFASKVRAVSLLKDNINTDSLYGGDAVYSVPGDYLVHKNGNSIYLVYVKYDFGKSIDSVIITKNNVRETVDVKIMKVK
jgi:hypothetical protein